MVSGHYQYGTSPRKLSYQDEIHTRKKEYNLSTNKNIKRKKKSLNQKISFVLYLAIGFSVLLAVSYRNSLITEEFNRKQNLKEELSKIEKESQQLQVGIESSLNLNNIGQSAKEMLGMQKLENSQKIYISLPKKDYVEAATEEVKIEVDKTWYEKVIDGFVKKIK